MFLVPQPDKPDKTSADPTSWLALECKATEKLSATGAYKHDIPGTVYSSFNFMQTELESGWFAILIEADDKDDYGKKNLTKVCESDTKSKNELLSIKTNFKFLRIFFKRGNMEWVLLHLL